MADAMKPWLALFLVVPTLSGCLRDAVAGDENDGGILGSEPYVWPSESFTDCVGHQASLPVERAAARDRMPEGYTPRPFPTGSDDTGMLWLETCTWMNATVHWALFALEVIPNPAVDLVEDVGSFHIPLMLYTDSPELVPRLVGLGVPAAEAQIQDETVNPLGVAGSYWTITTTSFTAHLLYRAPNQGGSTDGTLRAYSVENGTVMHAINATLQNASWGLSGVSMTLQGDAGEIAPFRRPENFYFDAEIKAGHGVQLTSGPLVPFAP